MASDSTGHRAPPCDDLVDCCGPARLTTQRRGRPRTTCSLLSSGHLPSSPPLAHTGSVSSQPKKATSLSAVANRRLAARSALTVDHTASCSPALCRTSSPRAVVSSVLNPGHHCLGGLCSSAAFPVGASRNGGPVAVPAAKKRSSCLGHPVRGCSLSPRKQSLAGLFDRAAPAAKGASVCATERTLRTAVSCVGREHLRRLAT